MILDFPDHPVIGQHFPDPPIDGLATWIFDGEKWDGNDMLGHFLPLAGGSMRGPIILDGEEPAGPLEAIDKDYADARETAGIAHANDTRVPLIGPSTISGSLVVGTNASVSNTTTSNATTALGFSSSGAIANNGNLNAFQMMVGDNYSIPVSAYIFMAESNIGGPAMNVYGGGNAALYARCDFMTNAHMQISYQSSTNGRGYIETINGTSIRFVSASDERLKTDLVDVVDSGAVIDDIDAVTFSSRGLTERCHGFSAQQVSRRCPWATQTGQGEPHNDDFVPWMMDYAKLVPVLWAEIRSLRAVLVELEQF